MRFSIIRATFFGSSMEDMEDWQPATMTLKDGISFEVMQREIDNSEWREVVEKGYKKREERQQQK